MPQTRKNRNSRKQKGGVHPHPAGTWYDNKDQPQPPYPPNRPSGRRGTERARAPSPPPPPPPLRRTSSPYDRSEQQDLYSSDGSSISSHGSSEGSYISSPTSSLSSDDGERWRASTLGSWAAIMGDAADINRIQPRYRQTAMRGTRLDFDNVGSGLLKKSRKSRKGRKMRKSRKGRGKTRKNRRRSRRHRRHRR